MKIILHIYPSNFLFESRIERHINWLNNQTWVFKNYIFARSKTGKTHAKKLNKKTFLSRLSNLFNENKVAKPFNLIFWNLRVFFEILKLKPSILVCHSLSCFIAAYLSHKFCKIKIIYEPHELETETQRVPNIIKPILRKFEKNLIKKSSAVIVVSKSIANWYKKKYNQKKIRIIYNVPASKNIQKDKKYFQKKYNLQKKPIFLYQGLFSEGRGLRQIINVFTTLSNKCILILMGFGIMNKELRKLAKNSKNIFFHNPIASDSIIKISSQADFGISLVESSSLSYMFCMPNKFFEYIFAGLPVLAGITKDQSEIIKRFKIGECCDPDNPIQLKEKILKMIRYKKKYCRNLYKTQKNFSWSNQEKILKKIYAKIS